MKTNALLKRLGIFLLCLCMLASCGDGAETTAPEPVAPQALEILANGETQYKIVYAEGGEKWEKSFATRLQNSIYAVTGVKIPVEGDSVASPDKNACEIVVGTPSNNRYATYASTKDIDLGYRVFVDGNRLIFDVASKTGAFFALSAFSEDLFGVDLESGEKLSKNEAISCVAVVADYTRTRKLASAEFPYLGAPLESFEIAVNTENYLQFSLGQALAKEFLYRVGVEVNVYDSYWGLEEDRAYIVFNEDDTLTKGAWRIDVVNETRIEISAGDYYGFDAAIEKFTALRNAEQYFDLHVSDTFAGSYTETLDNKEQTAKYAFEKKGEHRVMFYNVLWGDNYYQEFYYDAVKRDPFELALLDIYRPDVLGLQEVNNSRRGIGNKSDLIGKLEDMGYAETIDPRVENMKSVEDGGYGIGGYKVTREDGSVYYTYYNCAPILYNTKTTTCIESGYHWYTQQINSDWTPGLGDCASKALTWGVFESIATGERYIVVNTHMRGGDVSLSQAQEAVAIIDSLLAKYPTLPVFFGGDFNSKEGSAAFDHFVSDEVGYASVQQKRLATEFCSNIRTDHGYPLYINGIMTEGNGSVQTVKGKHDSIDNIFVTNHSGVSLNVFGVVVDFCSLRGSDHLPIFIDFNIN